LFGQRRQTATFSVLRKGVGDDEVGGGESGDVEAGV